MASKLKVEEKIGLITVNNLHLGFELASIHALHLHHLVKKILHLNLNFVQA